MEKAIYYLLDVFTNTRFGGNQLAVFPKADKIPEELFPVFAKELNLSESVFLFTKKESSWPMRIFTPGGELPTAGHPTIGTAFYLSREADHDSNKPLELMFDQKIGLINSRVEFKNNLPQKSFMYQPLPKFMGEVEDRKTMSNLLNLEENKLLDIPIEIVSCGIPYIIIPLKSMTDVRNINFRLDIWQKIKSSFPNAFVYAFCLGGVENDSDVHGRMFAPDAGILEDPATGSANGPLGCYCVKHNLTGNEIVSEQGYEMGRKSKIYIDIKKNKSGDINEVKIGGYCVFIGKGEIFM